ncbi:hypothetical protein HOY80DRAFT_895699 [Tuber brumale]|nr:hypothetical protein HOY80DRAFT_895699 [Tuber brumale]
MPRVNRSAWRDTYVYTSNNPTKVLGGLRTAPGVTNNNFYSMIEICCIFTAPFDLHDEHGQLGGRDGQQLQPGNYYIATAGRFFLYSHHQPLLIRNSASNSYWTGDRYRAESFCNAVHMRDRGCVITGRAARLERYSNWDMFEAAHIFPSAYQQQWVDGNFCRWITVSLARESDGTSNSIQNGILLGIDIHRLFDCYKLTINPMYEWLDLSIDDYKIVCFAPDTLDYNIAGRHLDQTFLNNPLRPIDQILRWHFRQAVLVNMRGAAGKSSYETGFPPGLDMMAETIEGAKAEERMEFELFSRFNAMGNCA